MVKSNTDITVDSFVRVEIPTTAEFLAKWHVWIHGKVTKHYKRDKERIPDTVQRVRLRLLSKDFIPRWFFKHLVNDLIDFSEAVRMTGSPSFHKVIQASPIYGDRGDSRSIWKISDILSYSNFDYERFFYSVQNHTIETDKFLRLLGYGSDDFSILEALYRQGRIKPSELTEHDCSANIITAKHNGKCTFSGCELKHFSRGFCKTHYRETRKNSCCECDKGRAILKQKGISLANRWNDPGVSRSVSKLRWNDSQLTPFLREWNNTNLIKGPPRYIMRLPKEATIDAGLLKYANMVVSNDVFNHFKSMMRTDDISFVALDVKSDPDGSTVEKMHWESDDDGSNRSAVFIDNNATDHFNETSNRRDVYLLIKKANLSEIEKSVITKVDLEETNIADVATQMGMTSIKINKIRTSAIDKMRVLV